MVATKFLSNTSTLLPLHHPILPLRKKPSTTLTINAAYGGSNSGKEYYDRWGKEVEENLIVLRMRIKEIKMAEKSDEPLPSHWMEWEKNYYGRYNEDVLEAIGLLQNYLTGVRPGQALGLVAVLALSLVIASGVVISEAVEIVRMVFLSSGFHIF